MSNESLPATEVAMVAHPAERGRRPTNIPAQAGPGCTCCCCCCLYTVGGIIGAAVGPMVGKGAKTSDYLLLTQYWEEEDYKPGSTAASKSDPDAITEQAPASSTPTKASSTFPDAERGIALPPAGISAVALYWRMFLAVMVVTWIVMSLYWSRGSGGFSMLIGGIVLLLILPGIQLAAATLTALILGVSGRPDLGYQMKQLGKITLGMVIGTVLGAVGTVGLFFAMLYLG